MNQDPNDHLNKDQYSDDQYSDDQYLDDQLSADNAKRRKGLFNLTGLGARLVATALAIGLGVVILTYAMSSSAGDTPEEIVDLPPTVTVNAAPLATWTPGPTSTPPPPANPTPEPVAPEEGAPAEPVDPNAPAVLGVGSQVKVTETGGFGVNMREGSGVTFAIVETVLDETILDIIEGPVDGDGYTWWRVRIEDGREGWVVQDFMALIN